VLKNIKIPNTSVFALFLHPEQLKTLGSCHKRQKPQAPTPQVLIRNRQTREVANAKGINRLYITLPNNQA